jgi:hypothetical protein
MKDESLDAARDIFFSALKTHEEFVYKLGYEAGFQAGWEAFVKHLSQSKPDPSMVDANAEFSELHRDEIPARDALVSIVEQTPGLGRQEILEQAKKSLTLSERSLRTALQRLKETGLLRVEEGKWYVAFKNFR